MTRRSARSTAEAPLRCASFLKPWWLAIRPATLSAALVPVSVGTAYAFALDRLRVGPALACLAGALLIQIGTNLANDVFDFEKGADREGRLGPIRVVHAGLLSGRTVYRAMVTAFALAAGIGVYLTWIAGPIIVVIGMASVAAGVAYTAGPYPLAYHGLGDLFTLAFFGFVAVTGTAFVQLGFVPASAWGAAYAVGALTAAILVVNNIRDRQTDAAAGKLTWAARWGRSVAEIEYAFLLTTAYGVPLALAALGTMSPWVALILLTVPFSLRLWHDLRRLEGAALNPLLKQTAKLLLVFGGLLTIGIAAQ